jgi:cell division septum initiation protein DivIVA
MNDNVFDSDDSEDYDYLSDLTDIGFVTQTAAGVLKTDLDNLLGQLQNREDSLLNLFKNREENHRKVAAAFKLEQQQISQDSHSKAQEMVSDARNKARQLMQEVDLAVNAKISAVEGIEENHRMVVEDFQSEQLQISQDSHSKAQEIISNAMNRATLLIREADSKVKEKMLVAETSVLEMQDSVQLWKIEQELVAHTQKFEPRVRIDIGGVCFNTTAATLCRFPDTFIGVLFSGKHALPLDNESCHFIDRDGTHFRHILNFLRDPKEFLVVELSAGHLRELKREAKYFGVYELMFGFRPAEDVQLMENLTGSGIALTASQTASGLWQLKGNKKNNYISTTLGTATIDPKCGCAYIKGKACAGYDKSNFGVKKFLIDTRKIDDYAQPAPKGRECPVCQGRGE